MLHYTHMTLDRCSQNRKDRNWLISQFGKSSRWLLVCDDLNLFDNVTDSLKFLTQSELASLSKDNAIFLGKDDEHSYFALDVSNESEWFSVNLPSDTEFKDMRKLGPTLEPVQASIGVLAKGLCYWHRTHQFCGRCGHKNKLIEAGHSRACTNEKCRHLTFPRTDPAVIMLVTHTFSDGIERCLLGRQASWPEGVYSTLAGFVDPGETLEQAVIREVYEEAGVEVSSVEYKASQPWPFPSSIMLGFFAKASTTDIFVEQDELEEAKWFSKADLNTFSEWGADTPGYKLTRKDSISRFLVEQWRSQEGRE